MHERQDSTTPHHGIQNRHNSKPTHRSTPQSPSCWKGQQCLAMHLAHWCPDLQDFPSLIRTPLWLDGCDNTKVCSVQVYEIESLHIGKLRSHTGTRSASKAAKWSTLHFDTPVFKTSQCPLELRFEPVCSTTSKYAQYKYTETETYRLNNSAVIEMPKRPVIYLIMDCWFENPTL